MDASFFRGTNAEQDPRFSDKQKKLRKTTEFPAEFNTKVNLRKVNMTVIRPWVTQQITEHLGFEDEVVIEFVLGMLEENSPDPKDMQINLTGFLSRKAPVFVLDLWKLLISAQNSLGGIPPEFLEQKKREILNKKVSQEAHPRKLGRRSYFDHSLRRSHRDRRTSENRRDHSRTRTHDHSRSRSRSPRRR
ncbi:PWI domain-containing protein [Dimargaris cristalligena]|uniref:PWI domain-containing protein n=1 Tax=Dimargaris cristalligena TaxID=215637 RepID=A0A4P9ZPC3_9FUNG|nr:PWI domain-containing protein [Dimargaris cristalligena]|eukprot:RKP35157.1 PWI domain-containing protein [Dimargaris cristalligena]